MANASALVEFLLRTPSSGDVEPILTDPTVDLHVPALCDVETAAALRSLALAGILSTERCSEALIDYLDLPLTRHGHTALLARALELRENLSSYDATYVTLAEALEAELLTSDGRLARAVEAHTGVALSRG